MLGQSLGQITSNVVKNKETDIVSRFFSYFAWGIPFRAKGRGWTNTWAKI